MDLLCGAGVVAIMNGTCSGDTQSVLLDGIWATMETKVTSGKENNRYEALGAIIRDYRIEKTGLDGEGN